MPNHPRSPSDSLTDQDRSGMRYPQQPETSQQVERSSPQSTSSSTLREDLTFRHSPERAMALVEASLSMLSPKANSQAS